MTREEQVQRFAEQILIIKMAVDEFGLDKMRPVIRKWMEATATMLWKKKNQSQQLLVKYPVQQ